LWFAGNAVAADLTITFELDTDSIASLTSFVQFGFITGTLLFAFLKISDKYSPSKVFLVCGILGAASNFGITLLETDTLLLPLRFATGFFLAGIYPVGMKIASDYHQKGLGLALGYLVGALVLGTASPHLLRDFFLGAPWQYVFYSTSALATIGALVVGLVVPDGPYRRPSPSVDPTAFFRVFLHRRFRSAAIGYFGHMWELYAFYAFAPVFLSMYAFKNQIDLSVSLLTFFIIGIGGLGCVLGGYASRRIGSDWVATAALTTSLVCCIVSPFVLELPFPVFISFLLLWGAAVVMDSPQFSTLVAGTAPKESIGTALTIVNSLGFAITIVSIQLLSDYRDSTYLFLLLAPGPAMGLIFFITGYLRRKHGD
jgi:predicted MFS family arabinose efflux permease